MYVQTGTPEAEENIPALYFMQRRRRAGKGHAMGAFIAAAVLILAAIVLLPAAAETVRETDFRKQTEGKKKERKFSGTVSGCRTEEESALCAGDARTRLLTSRLSLFGK